MKMNINFKSGALIGCIFGLFMLGFGYFSLQKIKQKADNVAHIDLHQFEYQDLDGNDILLSDFEGKNILVNFWATWCGPCIQEFPLLDNTYEQLNKDFIFLMISDESIAKIKKFADAKPYKFTYLKTNSLITKGIVTVPQSFILDKSGHLIQHHPTIFEGTPDALVSIFSSWVIK